MIWKNHLSACHERFFHDRGGVATGCCRHPQRRQKRHDCRGTSGDVGDVMSCLMADANCVNEREHDRLDCTLLLLRLCLKFVAEFVL